MDFLPSLVLDIPVSSGRAAGKGPNWSTVDWPEIAEEERRGLATGGDGILRTVFPEGCCLKLCFTEEHYAAAIREAFGPFDDALQDAPNVVVCYPYREREREPGTKE